MPDERELRVRLSAIVDASFRQMEAEVRRVQSSVQRSAGELSAAFGAGGAETKYLTLTRGIRELESQIGRTTATVRLHAAAARNYIREIGAAGGTPRADIVAQLRGLEQLEAASTNAFARELRQRDVQDAALRTRQANRIRQAEQDAYREAEARTRSLIRAESSAHRELEAFQARRVRSELSAYAELETRQRQMVRAEAAAYREVERTPLSRFRRAEARLDIASQLGAPEEQVLVRRQRLLRAATTEPTILAADPTVPQRLRDTEEALTRVRLEATKSTGIFGRLREELRKVGIDVDPQRLLLWAVGWTAVYRAINLVITAVGALTIGAFREFAKFQMQTIAMASELVNLDPSRPFDEAIDSARGLVGAMAQLQPLFIGTSEQLNEALLGVLRYFRGIDLSTKAARENFVGFANALVLATAGINRQGQILQEIRSISEGVVRPGAQLLQILRAVDPEIVKHIRQWRQLGTQQDEIMKRLPGYSKALEQITNTFQGQLNRLQANWQRALRQVGEAPGGPLTAVVRNINRTMESFRVPGREDVPGAGGAFMTAAAQAGIVSLLVRPILRALITQAAQRAAIAGAATAAGGPAVGGAVALAQVGVGLALFFAQARAIWERFKKDVSQPLEVKIRVAREELESVLEDFQSVEGILARFRAGELDASGLKNALTELFEAGAISGEEFVRALRTAVDLIPKMLANNPEKATELTNWFLGLTKAARQTNEELVKLLRTQQQLFQLVERPEVESRIRAQLTRSTPVQLRELETQAELSQRRIDLARVRRMLAPTEAKQLDIDREITAELEKQAGLTRQILDLQRELNSLLATQQARVFQAAGMSGIAQFIEMQRQLNDEMEQWAGNTTAQRAILRGFLYQSARLLTDSAEALKRARGEFVEAFSLRPAEAITQFRQAGAGLLGGILGFGREDETESQVRQRLERLKTVQLEALQDEERRTREELGSTMLTEEQRERLGRRLAEVIREEARARFDLNRQIERETQLARGRDLEAEERSLLRRLSLLQRMGGGAAAAGIETRLQRVREERELRGMPARELREELGGIQQMLLAPQRFGIGVEEFHRLQARAALIRKLLAEQAAQQAQQKADMENVNLALEKTTDILYTKVLPALRSLGLEAAKGFQQAQKDYNSLYQNIVSSLPTLTKMFRELGDELDRFRGVFPAFPAPQQPYLPQNLPSGAGGTTIYINGVNISDYVSPAVEAALAGALVSAAGDNAVRRARIQHGRSPAEPYTPR